MKKSILMLPIFLIFIAAGSAAQSNKHGLDKTRQTEIKMDTIKIKVGAQTFTASLSDNETTQKFLKMLPMELKMADLYNNEKYADLPEKLPTQAYSPDTIKTGDIMLFGSRTLVLFYKTFSTTYSYTRLGSIDDANGLEDALGKGDVTITFQLE